MCTTGPFRVAVITPYYREPLGVLRRCHDSVRVQDHPCTHFMVADGRPVEEVSRWAVEHVVLSKPHCDNGNTPRCIGSLSAMNLGYDAIAYLDADNWFYRDHVGSMVQLHRQSGAAICTATRMLHRLDGSPMHADTTDSDGRRHVDTSCLFITRAAFRVLPLWAMMPTQLGPVCDRVFWQAVLARSISHAHHPVPTVAFRTQYQAHYRHVGETPPPGTKTDAESTDKADQWWNSLPAEVREQWAAYFRSAAG